MVLPPPYTNAMTLERQKTTKYEENYLTVAKYKACFFVFIVFTNILWILYRYPDVVLPPPYTNDVVLGKTKTTKKKKNIWRLQNIRHVFIVFANILWVLYQRVPMSYYHLHTRMSWPRLLAPRQVLVNSNLKLISQGYQEPHSVASTYPPRLEQLLIQKNENNS